MCVLASNRPCGVLFSCNLFHSPVPPSPPSPQAGETENDPSTPYEYPAITDNPDLAFIKGTDMDQVGDKPGFDHDDEADDDEAQADDDSDMEDEDEFDGSTYNAGKPALVAHLTEAKAYAPEVVGASAGKGFNSKYCWTVADEQTVGLPRAHQAKVELMDLRRVRTHYSSPNLLIVEGAESCVAITGTLKFTHTPTKYILVDDKIFEWVRGAAASG